VCPYCESTGRGGKFCSCRSVAKNARWADEWHEDNQPAADVALCSKGRHKWRCSGCGHVWTATPNNRIIGNTNCPECFRKRKGKSIHDSLALGRPDLAAEWEVGKNSCSAKNVTCGSRMLAWWVCKSCGEAWKAMVYQRACKSSGCPKCLELYRLKPRILI
jgi:hypothetical protein